MKNIQSQILSNISYLEDRLKELDDEESPRQVHFLKSEIDIQHTELLKIQVPQFYKENIDV